MLAMLEHKVYRENNLRIVSMNIDLKGRHM